MNEETRLHRLKYAEREVLRLGRLLAAAQKEVDDLSMSFPTPKPHNIDIICYSCGGHVRYGKYQAVTELCAACY